MDGFARIRSDYSPDTLLLISRSEDGDVGIKIVGDGEMRIATDGGHLHGDALVMVIDAFQTLINVINCYDIPINPVNDGNLNNTLHKTEETWVN